MLYLPYQYTVISVICQCFATFDNLPHHFSHETKIHICCYKFFHFLAYFYQNHGYFFRFKNFLYFKFRYFGTIFKRAIHSVLFQLDILLERKSFFYKILFTKSSYYAKYFSLHFTAFEKHSLFYFTFTILLFPKIRFLFLLGVFLTEKCTDLSQKARESLTDSRHFSRGRQYFGEELKITVFQKPLSDFPASALKFRHPLCAFPLLPHIRYLESLLLR